ncbi:MAG TPA: hypothetical protein VM238_07915 [Phycisphaerae bacterium]|nr:hypothetical protein [Phycisphaerae bacterium]
MSGQAGQSARRRELLRSLVRYPVLGALGLVGWQLATRQPDQGPVQAGQTCINRGVCRGCAQLSTCALPQGLMARDTREQAKPYERAF